VCNAGVTYEINTNGGDVGLCVGIIGKSQKQARLSDTRVSNEEQLEEVVVSRVPLADGSVPFCANMPSDEGVAGVVTVVLWT